jgi:hypothetical protein
VAIVIRVNSPTEVMSLKEWDDLLRVDLHQRAPTLLVADTAGAQDWLELSVVTTDMGGVLDLSVYRWVRVLSSGEVIFSKVWSDQRLVIGGISRNRLRDVLDALITSIAADYQKAQ